MSSRGKLIGVILVVLCMVSGVFFILAAFSSIQQHPLFWYLQDGKVYKYDLQTHVSRPVPIPIQGVVYSARLSNNGQEIAYHDDAGLTIASVSSTSTYLLAANEPVMSGTIVLATQFYFPVEWSPDDKQLIVGKFYVDSDSLFLASIQDKTIRPIGIGCATDQSWSPTDGVFALSFFGMGPCEGRGGVFTVSTSDLALRQIYHAKLALGAPPPDVVEGGTLYVKWSPRGDRIAIIQVDQEVVNGQPRSSRLLLLNPNGDEPTVLVSAIGNFEGLNWSPDGTKLYYILNGVVRSLEIRTQVSQDIFSSSNLYLNSVSPNNQWLAIRSPKTSADSAGAVLLLNLSDSEIIRIEGATAIGWEMAMH
jgi:WD40 repeat protein